MPSSSREWPVVYLGGSTALWRPGHTRLGQRNPLRMTPDREYPEVRVAVVSPERGRIKRNNPFAPPVIRFAHVAGAQGDNVLKGQRGVKQLPRESAPALLISFAYLDGFEKERHNFMFRDWALDSGAFSAMNMGTIIKLDDYIEKARELQATDPELTEIFALDVIGDWRATVKNTESMWAAGVEAIPTFHGGQPWDVLKGLARDYPKVAIGGVAMRNKAVKLKLASEVFARVWPKRIHGFGYGADVYLETFPFHSVDATNWEVRTCKFGQWAAFGNQNLGISGSEQNLRVEVEHILTTERRARSRWAREMEKLR